VPDLKPHCTGVKVLFTGQHWPGANTVYIARAFEQLGAVVSFLNDTGVYASWTTIRGRVARRMLHRPVVEHDWNAQFIDRVRSFQPDLVYVTNGDFCRPESLRATTEAGIPLMCFYHDVPWRHREHSRFGEVLSLFDLVSTTREWQAEEFRRAGARAVMKVRFGCDPEAHRPVNVVARASSYYGSPMCFIGGRRTIRTRDLAWVASEFPSQLKIWGPDWDRGECARTLLDHWQHRGVQESEIRAIYASSSIALHWVLQDAESSSPELQLGDQHNSRTFQIAACGSALMVAQRTEDHVRFFDENHEAVFFASTEELVDKLRFWLNPAREHARRRIAAAARARCLAEDYSYVPVVRQYLQHFGLPAATTNPSETHALL
jgi:spore maturation protein CgeB